MVQVGARRIARRIFTCAYLAPSAAGGKLRPNRLLGGIVRRQADYYALFDILRVIYVIELLLIMRFEHYQCVLDLWSWRFLSPELLSL